MSEVRTLLLLVPEFECFRTNPAVMQRDLAGIQNSQNPQPFCAIAHGRDRKSTRLNSSHQIISYAVFCLKKKKKKNSACYKSRDRITSYVAKHHMKLLS